MSFSNKNNKTTTTIQPMNRKKKSQSLRYPTTKIPHKPSKLNTTTLNVFNNSNEPFEFNFNSNNPTNEKHYPFMIIDPYNLSEELIEKIKHTNKVTICYKEFPINISFDYPVT